MRVQSLERVGDRLRIIDQTRLPLELIYKDLDDYRDIITAIKRLEVRGAPAIGIAAAYGLAIAAVEEHHRTGRLEAEFLRRVGKELKAARPTAINLGWAVERMLARLNDGVSSPDETIASLWREAEAIHDEDRRMCRRIGQYGADLIDDGASVLTHCNAGALATGGIGTALGVIYTCRDQGKKLHVYVDETRPLLQGARLTAWELQQEGIPLTLICDNTAGFLMSQGKVDCVIVGADRIAANGDTANKIGTYSLAVLAKAHGLPFYVAAPASTFDHGISSGRDIPIEERSAEELTAGFGRRTAPTDIPVYSPAFDVTPNRLITAFVTDTGVRSGGRNV